MIIKIDKGNPFPTYQINKAADQSDRPTLTKKHIPKLADDQSRLMIVIVKNRNAESEKDENFVQGVSGKRRMQRDDCEI